MSLLNCTGSMSWNLNILILPMSSSVYSPHPSCPIFHCKVHGHFRHYAKVICCACWVSMLHSDACVYGSHKRGSSTKLRVLSTILKKWNGRAHLGNFQWPRGPTLSSKSYYWACVVWDNSNNSFSLSLGVIIVFVVGLERILFRNFSHNLNTVPNMVICPDYARTTSGNNLGMVEDIIGKWT